MKRLLIGALTALLIPCLALAQVAGPGAHSTANIGAVGGAPFTLGQQTQAAALPTVSAALTSTGFVLVSSFSVSTGFTPPANSTVCFVQAEGNNVRFRTDGTAPTASTGQLLPTSVLMQLTANLAGVRFIPVTGSATLDVDCYK